MKPLQIMLQMTIYIMEVHFVVAEAPFKGL
jgi:hypothetical protein